MKRTLKLAMILVAALSAAAQNAGYNPQPKPPEQAISDAPRQTQTQPLRIPATVPSLMNVSLPARNDASVYTLQLVEHDTEAYPTENDLGYPLGAKLGTAIRNQRARHFVKAFCKKNGNGALWSYPFQDRLITGTCGH